MSKWLCLCGARTYDTCMAINFLPIAVRNRRKHYYLSRKSVKCMTSWIMIGEAQISPAILNNVVSNTDDTIVITLSIFCGHFSHYNDVIMTTMASQITSLAVVYSTVYSDADQRKHLNFASLAFVWGIHRDRWIPRTKGQLRGKCFHLMTSSC